MCKYPSVESNIWKDILNICNNNEYDKVLYLMRVAIGSISQAALIGLNNEMLHIINIFLAATKIQSGRNRFLLLLTFFSLSLCLNVPE